MTQRSSLFTAFFDCTQKSRLEALESDVAELKSAKGELQARVNALSSELLNVTSRENASEPQVPDPDPNGLVSGGKNLGLSARLSVEVTGWWIVKVGAEVSKIPYQTQYTQARMCFRFQ